LFPSGLFQEKQSNCKPGDVARVSALCAGDSAMATGQVKFFNGQKGFGFIQPDEGGPDVFVHVTALERAGIRGLAEGQKVIFDVIMDRGKRAASNLQVV
jgi:CspA family cold shock protein